jgi:EAL domain-containing protein (putative c-di-GMP-specific phosphodiesterase class I)
MKSVAEGVEDRTDWDFVRSTGCDLAQGYFIARPMPPNEISGWIAVWEANVENVIGSPHTRTLSSGAHA